MTNFEKFVRIYIGPPEAHSTLIRLDWFDVCSKHIRGSSFPIVYDGESRNYTYPEARHLVNFLGSKAKRPIHVRPTDDVSVVAYEDDSGYCKCIVEEGDNGSF